jgi:hypothetical protein
MKPTHRSCHFESSLVLVRPDVPTLFLIIDIVLFTKVYANDLCLGTLVEPYRWYGYCFLCPWQSYFATYAIYGLLSFGCLCHLFMCVLNLVYID